MRKPFDVFRESNPDICVGVRQPSFELNNVCGTIQWQCTEDDIHVPLDLILEPKLGLPVLLIKVVSKTFPTLLEYKNLIFFGSPRDCCQHPVVWSRPPDSVLADAVWVQCFYAIRLTSFTPPSIVDLRFDPLKMLR